METKRLFLEKDEKQSIETASDILKKGGIVAIPTETVYGLAASAFDSDAITKIFNAKGRPQDNPLIVHIADISELKSIATDIPEKAVLCAERFWPGPFTMVLKKNGDIAENVSCGLDTVAVRMPSDETARKIIKVSGIPLAAPSANTSGMPSPTTAEHVIADLDGKIDAVVIGKRSCVGIESTVVSFVGEKPRLLRPGAVTLEQLSEVIPDIEVDKAVLSCPEKGEKVASPGMKYKHYSPKCELYLIDADAEKYAEYVNNKSDGVAVCFEEDKTLLKCRYEIYGKLKEPDTMAYGLFDVLRELDKKGIKKGYVHSPEKFGVGLAVYNRLIRACAYKEVKL